MGACVMMMTVVTPDYVDYDEMMMMITIGR